MIKPAQLKLLERAREASTPDPAVFAEVLRRSGGVDSVEALTAEGYDRLMDHFTVVGFKNRQRPILEDLKSILFTSGTEFQVLRAEKLLPQLAPDELARTILGALAQEEGANAVADVIELAAQVVPPGGPIAATHVRAAIREKFAGTDKARQTMLQLGRLPWPDLSQRRA